MLTTFYLKRHLSMLEKFVEQAGVDIGAQCRAVEAYANTLVAFYQGWLFEYNNYVHVAYQITQYLGQNEILTRSIKDIVQHTRNENTLTQINTEYPHWAPLTKADLSGHASMLDDYGNSIVSKIDESAPSDAMINIFPRAGAAIAYAATVNAFFEGQVVSDGITKIVTDLQEMQASESNFGIHRALEDVLDFIQRGFTRD